jgi:hypothetical protein
MIPMWKDRNSDKVKIDPLLADIIERLRCVNVLAWLARLKVWIISTLP